MTTPYDGTNSDLCEPHCAKCGVTEGSESLQVARLLRCTRCGVVTYCGAACQKKDLAKHKKACRDVQEATRRLNYFADELKNFSRHPDEEPWNFFEEEPGSFWGFTETRDYMIQRISLIAMLSDLAREMQTKDAWSLVADHMQECLRLNLRDNNGIRYAFPLVLLRVNRDDDAYCFCKYWTTFDDWLDEDEVYISSDEGDWLYPRQKDCRYLDVFKDCEELEEAGQLWIFLAFAVIKMRLVAVFEARKNELNSVSAAPSKDEQAREVMEVERQLVDQGKQLDRLLDLIDARNKTMVPALLHPGPLMSRDPPYCYSLSGPSDARMILPDVLDLWNSIPGASAYLAKRLGTTTPSYATH